MKTKLTEHTGVEYPIICGAMYPCSNPELVAAAAEGGGMAIMQPVSLTYVHGWDLKDGIRYIKSKTSKPFGFNALIEKGSKKYMNRMSSWIDIALEEGIRFFVTSLGKPDWVCERVHQVGGRVYHDVTNKQWAQKGIDAGIDGLICVNNRAGGHLGPSSMENLFEELSGLGKPLVCAGGIGSRIELNKAMNLGYDGVQMGTRFIATNECNTPEDWKGAIIKASENDIVTTKRFSGVPVSVIKSDNFKSDNNWIIRTLLKSPFKHTTRTLLNIKSILYLKYLSKQKSSGNKNNKKQFYSAGKSVETIKGIDSANILMRTLGESLKNMDRTIIHKD